MAPVCVVCACPADLYCHNDDANLCYACDHAVHSAHAITRNHRRTPIRGCCAKDDSLDEHIAVPQELLPLGKTERLNDIDLSFSDDGWFTVPDTACSTVRSAAKPGKGKSFELDDLFGFDAALDEEVAFALDPADDLLSDCLVPIEAVVPTDELSPPSPAAFKEEVAEQVPEADTVHSPEAVPAPAVSPPPPHAAQAPSIAFTYPSVCDVVPNVDNYIPHSLIPVDSSTRGIALAERREKVQRFREKKKNRQFKKLIRYASRKRYAEVRPRIKGRFARKDEIAAAKAAGVPLEC